MTDPKSVLTEGSKELEALLAPHGFQLHLGETDKGSGGYFCRGEFVRDAKKLEFSFRWSLGLVTYRLGQLELEHTEFMRVQGVKGAYPGFSDDPIEAFRHLRSDIENFGAPFISEEDDEFKALVEKAAVSPKATGFGGIG